MITLQIALQKLHESVKDESLRLHCRALEIVMRRAAHRYGGGAQDEEKFAVTGLIHDADWEIAPQSHPNQIVEWLKQQGENEIAAAVAAHDTGWGKPYDTGMAKSLVASDELTGFVMACAKVRPEGIASLSTKSVLKKFRDASFARSVDRHEIHAGLLVLGAPLADHIQFIIESLKPHAAELQLGPRSNDQQQLEQTSDTPSGSENSHPN